jgi:hypothetical protein
VLFNDAVKGYDYTESMADEVMSMKRSSDDTDREEQKYWEKNQFQFHNKSSPVTSLEWPRGFQEVKVPRFHDNGTGWW